MPKKKSTMPKRLKDKYGDRFKIWSYSNISSMGGDNCPHEYYLSRIKKLKGVDGIYGVLGEIGHNQLEAYYNKEINYEDMLSEFEKEYLGIELSDYKFCADENDHIKRSNAYKSNLIHFFSNHEEIPHKVATEVEFWTEFDDNVFVGFIDAIHRDENGDIVITDWKTSSYGAEYRNEKLQSKAHQLLIYAYAIHNTSGIPYDKIKCRWCFLKYCEVHISYQIKSKKEEQHKVMIAERTKWVDKVKTQLKKDIVRYYPDITELEQDILLEQCINNNSLDCLIPELRDNYKLHDFYLYTDVNEETIEELKEYVLSQIKDITSRGSDEARWERDVPISYVDEFGKTKDTSFYCNVLCGQKYNCKYYTEYLNETRANSDKNTISESDGLLDILNSMV